MLKQESYQQARLVEIGWRWASQYNGGHLAGQMVMHAMMNRTRCGWGSILENIDRIPQYMAEYEMPPLKHPSIWEPTFVKLLHAVDGIADGSAPDLSHGALYWGDLGHIERPWFQSLMSAVSPPIEEDGSGVSLRQHPIVANINSLTFFR